jgi:hypothetical protein
LQTNSDSKSASTVADGNSAPEAHGSYGVRRDEMLATLVETLDPSIGSDDSELAFRRQVNLVIGRALVDHCYAAILLDNPGRVLESELHEPQSNLDIGAINARSLQDLARQLQAMFWPSRS